MVAGCVAPGRALGYSESPLEGIDDLSLDRGLADRVWIPASEGGVPTPIVWALSSLIRHLEERTVLRMIMVSAVTVHGPDR